MSSPNTPRRSSIRYPTGSTPPPPRPALPQPEPFLSTLFNPFISLINSFISVPFLVFTSALSSVQDALTSPTLSSLIFNFIVIIILLIFSVFSALGTFLILRWIYFPEVVHTFPLELQFGHSRPPFSEVLLSSPPDLLPPSSRGFSIDSLEEIGVSKYLKLKKGGKYDVHMELDVLEDELFWGRETVNEGMWGNFMVGLELKDEKGEEIYKVERSHILPRPRHRSILSSLIPSLPPLNPFSSPSPPICTLHIPLLSPHLSFPKNRKPAIASVEVGRRDSYPFFGDCSEYDVCRRDRLVVPGTGKEIRTVGARLRFIEKVWGISYLLYYHPVISLAFFATSFLLFYFLFSLAIYYIYIAPTFNPEEEQSEREQRPRLTRPPPTTTAQEVTRQQMAEADEAESLERQEREALLRRREGRRMDRIQGGGLPTPEPEDEPKPRPSRGSATEEGSSSGRKGKGKEEEEDSSRTGSWEDLAEGQEVDVEENAEGSERMTGNVIVKKEDEEEVEDGDTGTVGGSSTSLPTATSLSSLRLGARTPRISRPGSTSESATTTARTEAEAEGILSRRRSGKELKKEEE